MDGDEVASGDEVVTGYVVVDRLVDIAARLVPLGCNEVELGDAIGYLAFGLEAAPLSAFSVT